MKHGVDLSAPCFFDVYIQVGILYNIFDVDKDAWKKELEGVEELYAKFGDALPEELEAELQTVKKNLD